jgi:hypothetical protein
MSSQSTWNILAHGTRASYTEGSDCEASSRPDEHDRLRVPASGTTRHGSFRLSFIQTPLCQSFAYTAQGVANDQRSILRLLGSRPFLHSRILTHLLDAYQLGRPCRDCLLVYSYHLQARLGIKQWNREVGPIIFPQYWLACQVDAKSAKRRSPLELKLDTPHRTNSSDQPPTSELSLRSLEYDRVHTARRYVYS